jgi:hypothetical protein
MRGADLKVVRTRGTVNQAQSQSLFRPDGAKVFLNGLHHKQGALGRLFYHDRNEWVRSNKDMSAYFLALITQEKDEEIIKDLKLKVKHYKKIEREARRLKRLDQART